MKVKALQNGFYNGARIRAGQEFAVADGDKGAWFVPVGEFKEPAGTKPTKAQPKTLSELSKAPATGPTDLA